MKNVFMKKNCSTSFNSYSFYHLYVCFTFADQYFYEFLWRSTETWHRWGLYSEFILRL